MIWVFKTSINSSEDIDKATTLLNRYIQAPNRWNFDLEDCDKILRIEHHGPDILTVINTLNENGICCEELPD